MDTRIIHVPIPLLQDPNHPPSFKLIWMAHRLEPDAGPVRLEALTGLSRNTIRTGLAKISAYKEARGCIRARIPAALLAERGVGAQAKVLYGLLQTLPGLRGHSGTFTRASLQALTSISRTTARLALRQLSGAGWVWPAPKSRAKPTHFRVGTPEQRRAEAEALRTARRLRHAEHRGEAIMQEYLSLLVDSSDWADNTKPGWLVNPLTGKLLELDRYYTSAKVAFEFHGSQHERASEQYPQQQVDTQRLRDLLKAGLCKYEEVHLIIVRAQDLSLEGMIKKIDRSLPLRPLAGHDRLIALLADEAYRYRLSEQAVRPR